jgi:hypothetical protein
MEQQREIIRLLVERGARADDPDSRGKTVAQSITKRWMAEIIQANES